MKKILIALFAIILLGGGGAGAYFYFQQPAQAALTEGEEAQKEPHKSDKDSHSSKHAFYELDPLLLPIVDDSGVSQVVSLVIVIEVKDNKTLAEVEHLAPRLKDAFIQDMYGVLNQHAALRGGVVQVGMIKKRLQKIAHTVLDEGQVEDVLLQVVQQRPF